MNTSTATGTARNLIICAVCLFFGGCASTGVPTRPAGTEAQSHQVPLNRSQSLDLAHRVLRDYHFRIEKEDVAVGYLRTHPLSGAQFFEFWRRDGRGRLNALESNLHSIRRTAEIRFRDEAGGTGFSCRVRVERFSVPDQPIESSSQGYQILSDSTHSVQKLRLTPYQERNMEWIDLGFDRGLAEAISREIVGKAGRARVREDGSGRGDMQG